MSSVRTTRLLLGCYPPAWRARYGEELEALIAEASGGRRVPWRIRLDVALAGGRERLRSTGLTGSGVPPDQRARAGSLLVLCAWAAFVVAGAAVEKLSEHWQNVTPTTSRGLPAAAFEALVIAAAIGSALVLAGIACAAPSLIAFLRAGRWREIRRPVGRGLLVSAVAAAATIALVVWAHRLQPPQRNGHDLAYALGFTACALFVVGSLVAWTAAAVATSRRISLTNRQLKVEAWLAAAVTGSMLTMTAATALWWAALANAAPWVLHGAAVGSSGSPLVPELLAAVVLMATATALGAAGTACALGAVSHRVRG